MDEEDLKHLLLQQLEAVDLGNDLLAAAKEMAQKTERKVRRLLDTDDQRPNDPARDRRSAARHACNREAFCHLVKTRADPGWRAAIMEISKDGLSILSPEEVGPGQIMILQEADVPPVHRKTRLARVVHAQKLLGNWRAGCSLATELTDQELQELLSRS